VILAGLALLATGWTIYGTACNVRRFQGLEQFFGYTKLLVPKLTMFVYDRNLEVNLIPVALAPFCGAATFKQRERRETLLLNMAGVVLPLLWWVFHTAMFYDAAVSILEGVGSRFHP
jgi:hypothetical protein